MLLYGEVLIVCPGDIEPTGWREIWSQNGSCYKRLIDRASVRLLVAPHHGRRSGYSEEMMAQIRPHLALVSDAWGDAPTYRAFRERPIGCRDNSGNQIRYVSTKQGGPIHAWVSRNGWNITQFAK